MPEEFGTVNMKRSQVAREFDVLRQRYYEHQEILARMSAEAPTETLARRYDELRREVGSALERLNELERVGERPPAAEPPAAAAAVPPPQPPGRQGWSERNLGEGSAPSDETSAGFPRAILILLVGIVVLAMLGYLATRYLRGGDAGVDPAIIETTEDIEPLDTFGSDPGTIEPLPTATVPPRPQAQAAPPPSALLRAAPQSQDYGVVAKGTRAVRQFQITNSGTEPLTVALSRSKCRCLWFDYDSPIPPGATRPVAITVDGALAKEGQLEETIEVTAKESREAATRIRIIARIE
jgi:hypothetical protein